MKICQALKIKGPLEIVILIVNYDLIIYQMRISDLIRYFNSKNQTAEAINKLEKNTGLIGDKIKFLKDKIAKKEGNLPRLRERLKIASAKFKNSLEFVNAIDLHRIRVQAEHRVVSADKRSKLVETKLKKLDFKLLGFERPLNQMSGEAEQLLEEFANLNEEANYIQSMKKQAG